MKKCVTAAAVSAAAMLVAVGLVPVSAQRALAPVTDAMLANPDPADWLMWRRTLNSWGYSPLEDIIASNVKQLQLVWTRPLAAGDQEGTALVHDGILYFPNPRRHRRRSTPSTGDFIWEYRRSVPEDVGQVLPGRGHEPQPRDLRQLDPRQRRRRLCVRARCEDRQARLGNAHPRLTSTARRNSSGPIVADGKVISGRSCEPKGGPEACVVTAFDAKTGKELWRHRTIPKPGEPGDETWGNIPYEQRWHVGMWMVPSYDPRRIGSTSARRSPHPRRSSCSRATTISTSTTTRRSRST